jgi:hypothetical protein
VFRGVTSSPSSNVKKARWEKKRGQKILREQLFSSLIIY